MIEVILGDITKIKVDAIVNAANSSLLGGGGVDGAIHKAGGPAILEECKTIRRISGGCPVGEAVITTAGKLPASYVIHTVGPVWSGGAKKEAALLKNAYLNSLKLADEKGLHSVAFPNISTGIFAYPKEEAAKIATETVKEYLNGETDITKVTFVCFDKENYNLYKNLINS